jgi:Holliday junction resolvase RusA-like endonuclease
MAIESNLEKRSESPIYRLEIPYKFPSLNEYIRECRANRYSGAKMKREIELDISWFFARLPRFDEPVKIHFHWVEDSKRRDLDNIAFGKKFILDALVKSGKLKDDNRRCVTAFTDTFSYGKTAKVILTIEEVLE